MTITLIDSPNRAGSSTKIDSLDLKSESEAKADPSEFGQLMSDILETRKSLEKTALQQTAFTEAAQQGVNGQEIAAQTPGTSSVSLLSGQDFLKTVILGPHLNVITPETSAPDEQSLEAFARSQGLDETAVQWLMGTPGQVPLTAQPLAVGGLNQGINPALASAFAATNANPNIANDNLMVQLASASGDGVASGEMAAVTNASPFALTSLQTAATDPATSAGVSRSDVPSNGGLLTSAALWALAQTTEKAHVQASKANAATEANDVQIHFMRTPPPAALWMQGNTGVTSQVKETLSQRTSVAVSELDLSDLASDEVLTKLAQIVSAGEASVMDATESAAQESSANTTPGAPPSPLSGHTGHRMDMATAARQEAQNTQPSAPDTSTAQRSETIQNLSEKMGQAVGQRILSEIEKGQWHLKLMLRPATLGHIEVEIRMRSGEMDAVFTAPQALTRELLQDGLSKLKDTLGQMGMDVASMQVGDGQTQQRGGDSTPNQTPKVTVSDSKDSKSTESNQNTISRVKMGKDGWDVLV